MCILTALDMFNFRCFKIFRLGIQQVTVHQPLVRRNTAHNASTFPAVSSTYRISSNRSRALNTSWASNTGRRSDVIVLVEAGDLNTSRALNISREVVVYILIESDRYALSARHGTI